MSCIDDDTDDPHDDSHDPGMMRRELIALLEAPSSDGGPSNLRRILEALIDMAKDKELAAIREVFDRVDGKAPTMAPITDDGNRKVIFEWVDNESSASASNTQCGPSSSPSTTAPSGSPAS
jgi:ribosomal protein L17